jgi:hypothetical protein
LAATIVGCSLSEYEDAMKFQQRKADYFDQQRQIIAPESIEWPDKPADEKEAKEAIAFNEIYYRPLKEIHPKIDPSPSDLVDTKIFVRYKAKERSFFRDLCVAARKLTDSQSQEKFEDRVLRALRMGRGMEKPPRKPGEEIGLDTPFKYYHQDGSAGPFLYFRTVGNICVAIAYRPTPEANPVELPKMEPFIDFTLGTVVLGLDAGRKRGPVAPKATGPASTAPVLPVPKP